MEYILVLGYGWSGSSAVVDLLKEYDCTYQIPVEFRLIKDPHGLMDLRHNLVDRWDQLNVDIAIKDFLWLVHYLNQPKTLLPTRAGLGYELSFDHDFLSSTKEYLKKIAPIRYEGNWWYFDFSKSGGRLLFERVMRKLNFRNKVNQTMYYSNISGAEFDNYSKQYIDSVFQKQAKGKQFVILDQAVPGQNPLAAAHFFSDFKILIVDRDPRDNYCDLINQHALIGEEINKHKDASFFIDWHRRNHEGKDVFSKDDRVKYISFEDLVCDYDNTVCGIEKFLGLSSDQHEKKRQYFNPDISKKNVGIWKQCPNREAIKEIEETLYDFLSSYEN